MFQYKEELKGEVTASKGIEKFMWFGVDDDRLIFYLFGPVCVFHKFML